MPNLPMKIEIDLPEASSYVIKYDQVWHCIAWTYIVTNISFQKSTLGVPHSIGTLAPRHQGI